MSTRRLIAAFALTTFACQLMAGCASKHKQLESVAKDWCETIRASQVIPVYPLTEDLHPGDVFLVQTAIADEASRYKARGFLPLDDYRTRLNLSLDAFSHEYFTGYWHDEFFNQAGNPRPSRVPGGVTITNVNAPRAAFPSYSFDVSNSGGLSIAVPIQGIPLALGLLNADRATASVTISDARTYAANPDDVYRATVVWAGRDDIRAQLRWAARTAKAPVYVRVVTRVYCAGAMNVSVTSKSAFGSDLAGGKAPKIDLIDETGAVNQKNIQALDVLNGEAAKTPTTTLPATGTDPAMPSAAHPPALPAAAGATPAAPTGGAPGTPAAGASTGAADLAKGAFDWANVGARVKFQSISSRSVSMAESFDTPLVIGYLGFDAPVYLSGEIGAPLPTFLRLEGVLSSPNELRSAENRYLQQALLLMGVFSHPPADAAEQLRWAQVVKRVSHGFEGGSFRKAQTSAEQVIAAITANPQANPSTETTANLQAAAKTLHDALRDYVGKDADAQYPVRTNKITDAFDIAFESTRV